MSFKGFSVFSFGGHFGSVKWNHFSNFGKGSPKEHFCEIILKLGHWPRRRCCLNVFSIFSSISHFVQWSGTILAILIEGHPKKHFCEIILKSGHWLRRGCHLKVFYFSLWRPFCSAELNHFSNFGSRSPKEHFGEIILKLGHWPIDVI